MADIDHIQPEGVYDSRGWGYTQVVRARAGHPVFVSGQVAVDPEMKSIGQGDLGEQTDLALENLRRSLAAAGGGPEHVTMMRIYVVDYDASKIAAISPRVAAFFGDSPPSAQTLLGVQALGLPELRIEIEAQAIVPE